VTGLSVEERDLVISTHGRSFWVLDDIETLREVDADLARADVHPFQPANAVRRSVPAVIDFRAGQPGTEGRRTRLDILTNGGDHVRTLVDEVVDEGTHRARWNLRYPGAVTFDGIVLEGGNPAVGPWAPPGRYRARLTVDGMAYEAAFDVHPDPRLGDVPATAFTDQFRLAMAIRDAESRANTSVLLARDLRSRADAIVAATDDGGLRDLVSRFAAGIEAVAGELYQLRNQSPKDKIAFPIKLNDRLTGLRSHLERVDGTPIDAYQAVFAELSAELEAHLGTFEQMLSDRLPRLNRRLDEAGLPQIIVRDAPIADR